MIVTVPSKPVVREPLAASTSAIDLESSRAIEGAVSTPSSFGRLPEIERNALSAYAKEQPSEIDFVDRYLAFTNPLRSVLFGTVDLRRLLPEVRRKLGARLEVLREAMDLPVSYRRSIMSAFRSQKTALKGGRAALEDFLWCEQTNDQMLSLLGASAGERHRLKRRLERADGGTSDLVVFAANTLIRMRTPARRPLKNLDPWDVGYGARSRSIEQRAERQSEWLQRKVHTEKIRDALDSPGTRLRLGRPAIHWSHPTHKWKWNAVEAAVAKHPEWSGSPTKIRRAMETDLGVRMNRQTVTRILAALRSKDRLVGIDLDRSRGIN